jgi:hypothetical protein
MSAALCRLNQRVARHSSLGIHRGCIKYSEFSASCISSVDSVNHHSASTGSQHMSDAHHNIYIYIYIYIYICSSLYMYILVATHMRCSSLCSRCEVLYSLCYGYAVLYSPPIALPQYSRNTMPQYNAVIQCRAYCTAAIQPKYSRNTVPRLLHCGNTAEIQPQYSAAPIALRQYSRNTVPRLLHCGNTVCRNTVPRLLYCRNTDATVVIGSRRLWAMADCGRWLTRMCS